MRPEDRPLPEDGEKGRHPRDRLRRELGLQDSIFLVVASVVGSGVFLTPGTIADRLPHVGLIFAAWLVGGLLSLAGALANAELGAMYPRAGGNYVYLREAFHPIAGFLVGWLSFFAIFAGTVATLAAGFAEGLAQWFGLGRGPVMTIAIATIVACSALNWVGVRFGATANNVTAWIKVVALTAFALVAPLSGAGDIANLGPWVEGAAEAATPLAFALALSPVLFSYLGWNASVYVASEIRKPGPETCHGRCSSASPSARRCTCCSTPSTSTRCRSRRYVRSTTPARRPRGCSLAIWAARCSRASCSRRSSAPSTPRSSSVPRIAYAMALDDLFPQRAGTVHDEYGTPSGAIAVQALVSVALLLALQSFPSALDYTTFRDSSSRRSRTPWPCTPSAAASPTTRARTGAWGYPWVPAVYIVANVAIVAGLLIGRPFESAISVLVLLSALPFYGLVRAPAAPCRALIFPIILGI